MKKLFIIIILIGLLTSTFNVAAIESHDDTLKPQLILEYHSDSANGVVVQRTKMALKPPQPIPTAPLPIGGPILWTSISPAFSTTTIGDNGNLIFTGNDLYDVVFKLFSTLGSGTPLWEYTVPDDAWSQLDIAGGCDVLVGLASNWPSFQRLYKWSSASSTPDWYYDVPPEYECYHGGFIAVNLRLSGDGSRVVLAVPNATQDLIHIFEFDALTGNILSSYALAAPYTDIACLDVSTDGSLVLICMNGITTYIVDMAASELRWTFEDGPAAFSGDGSLVALDNYTGGRHFMVAYRWNQTRAQYDLLWQELFVGNGWLVCGNGEGVLDMSEDGSTILTAAMGDLNTGVLLTTKTFMFNTSNGDYWEYTAEGQGNYYMFISALRLCSDGAKGIVTSLGDECHTVDEVMIFTKASPDPLLTIDAPGSSMSADISVNGTYAVTACLSQHNQDASYYQSIVYALDTTNPPQERRINLTVHGGLRLTARFRNTGNETITNIPWTMEIFYSKQDTTVYENGGSVPSLPVQTSGVVRSGWIMGFGRVSIILTVDAIEYYASGVILGPFIFIRSHADHPI